LIEQAIINEPESKYRSWLQAVEALELAHQLDLGVDTTSIRNTGGPDHLSSTR
jgi:hypothetical protein